MSHVEDSDRRCPHCSKRMMLDIGQDDSAAATGWVRMVHSCWSCGYEEIDENWKRPQLVLVSSRTSAERLRSLRMGDRGVDVPMVYTDEPFPVGDLG